MDVTTDTDAVILSERLFLRVTQSMGVLVSDHPLLWSFLARWFRECEPLLPEKVRRVIDRSGKFGAASIEALCILGKLQDFQAKVKTDAEEKFSDKEAFLDSVYGNVPRTIYDRICDSLKICQDCSHLSFVSRWEGPWKAVEEGQRILPKPQSIYDRINIAYGHNGRRYLLSDRLKVRDLCDVCLFNRRFQWIVASIFTLHGVMITHPPFVTTRNTQPSSENNEEEEEEETKSQRAKNFNDTVRSMIRRMWSDRIISHREISMRCRESIRMDTPICRVTKPSAAAAEGVSGPSASRRNLPSIDVDDPRIPPDIAEKIKKHVRQERKEEKQKLEKAMEMLWETVIKVTQEACQNAEDFVKDPSLAFERAMARCFGYNAIAVAAITNIAQHSDESNDGDDGQEEGRSLS